MSLAGSSRKPDAHPVDGRLLAAVTVIVPAPFIGPVSFGLVSSASTLPAYFPRAPREIRQALGVPMQSDSLSHVAPSSALVTAALSDLQPLASSSATAARSSFGRDRSVGRSQGLARVVCPERSSWPYASHALMPIIALRLFIAEAAISIAAPSSSVRRSGAICAP